LWTKSFVLHSNRPAMIGAVFKKLNFFIRWVGAANTSIFKNGLYFMSIVDSAATEEPASQFSWRLHYTDV